MLNKFKIAVNNAISGAPTSGNENGETDTKDERKIKFPYSRPDFLHLSVDEVQVSADHTIRPILVPRDISKIPWQAGYSEVINGGKSKWNEDQSRAGTFFVRGVDKNQNRVSDLPRPTSTCGAAEIDGLSQDPLPFTYFGVFDGHAGTGAAIMAANMLHNFIQDKLNNVRSQLITKRYALDETTDETGTSASNLVLGYIFPPKRANRKISADELVIGALEASFIDMDAVIKEESANYKVTGGCTAVVCLFFMGKLYVANAGDSRAVLVHNGKVMPLSTDCTPESERQRLQYLAKLKPELLHGEFSRLQFQRRVSRKDVGQQVLYRDAHMDGWAYKTVEEADCRIPLIYGEGKRARVLATIGVTRGFGDHTLTVLDTGIRIKPFLTPAPEVQVVDMLKQTFTENDVIIMGTDGLWDVIPNLKALEIVNKSLSQFEPDNILRYTSAAQDLVMAARGLMKKGWTSADNLPSSYDDITCFVIPLHKYGGTVLTHSGSSDSSSEQFKPFTESVESFMDKAQCSADNVVRLDTIEIADDNIELTDDTIEIADDNIEIADDNIEITDDTIEITGNIEPFMDEIEPSGNNAGISRDNRETTVKNMEAFIENTVIPEIIAESSGSVEVTSINSADNTEIPEVTMENSIENVTFSENTATSEENGVIPENSLETVKNTETSIPDVVQ